VRVHPEGIHPEGHLALPTSNQSEKFDKRVKP